MVRSPSIDKNGMKKGEWSKEEDDKLRAYINRFGTWNWRQLPRFAGLARCGKSCRLRWKNYLQPNVKRGNYTKEEEDIIINLHNQLGKKWSVFAKHLPGRTDNEIKNYWHTHLKKRTQAQNLILPSNQENAESSSQSSKILINTEGIKQESSQCEDHDKEIISTSQSQDLTSPNQSCCSVLSQSYSIQEDGVSAAKSLESSADFWNQQLTVEDYESTTQGSSCSEFSFNCVDTPPNLSDVMNWVKEDSTVTRFECFDDFWSQPFETDNQTTSAYKYEQPLLDPANVYNLSSPITEDVFLWSY